jgi:isochorismate synthase/2-succinyl-5-enolpyruvyl-6-hydroxy-3-cyclohexene-1-carboxylate synthase/2-succinyl-6-hydroxy-2,4-cyclohexadiene-1-carboxylate synthase/O-succinylbenzoate synthase
MSKGLEIVHFPMVTILVTHMQYFCIAPGSRSSPLAEAAAANPRVTCVSCIDERSMAFLAVGYGRGANKAAVVITTSGTAVSNLLPAVGL